MDRWLRAHPESYRLSYEGIASGSPAVLQRFLHWSQVLAGAAGHSYGAQGLWAFSAGLGSPGAMWGDATWQQGVDQPDAVHIGRGASTLRALGWAGAEPAQHLVSPAASADEPFHVWAGQIGGSLVAYVPAACFLPAGIGITQDFASIELQLTPETEYEVTTRGRDPCWAMGFCGCVGLDR